MQCNTLLQINNILYNVLFPLRKKMISMQGLQKRISDLKDSLKNSEKKFNDTRDLLKLCKKEITDTKWAILEVEKLLLEIDK